MKNTLIYGMLFFFTLMIVMASLEEDEGTQEEEKIEKETTEYGTLSRKLNDLEKRIEILEKEILDKHVPSDPLPLPDKKCNENSTDVSCVLEMMEN